MTETNGETRPAGAVIDELRAELREARRVAQDAEIRAIRIEEEMRAIAPRLEAAIACADAMVALIESRLIRDLTKQKAAVLAASETARATAVKWLELKRGAAAVGAPA